MTAPSAAPVSSAATRAPRPKNTAWFAKRDGAAAVADYTRSRPWPKNCRIHRRCPPLAPLPRCASEARRDADAVLRSETLAAGDAVTVRGQLGLGGGFRPAIQCGPCCMRAHSGVLLGTPPAAFHLESFGCSGDESRQCCDVPAFGQFVVASGKVQAASFDWVHLYGVNWSLIDVKLCEEQPVKGRSP